MTQRNRCRSMAPRVAERGVEEGVIVMMIGEREEPVVRLADVLVRALDGQEPLFGAAQDVERHGPEQPLEVKRRVQPKARELVREAA